MLIIDVALPKNRIQHLCAASRSQPLCRTVPPCPTMQRTLQQRLKAEMKCGRAGGCPIFGSSPAWVQSAPRRLPPWTPPGQPEPITQLAAQCSVLLGALANPSAEPLQKITFYNLNVGAGKSQHQSAVLSMGRQEASTLQRFTDVPNKANAGVYQFGRDVGPRKLDIPFGAHFQT